MKKTGKVLYLDDQDEMIAVCETANGMITLLSPWRVPLFLKYNWCGAMVRYSRASEKYSATYKPRISRSVYGEGTELLHRVIGGLVPGQRNAAGERLYIDHINGDTTDNRDCNLRVTTNRENCLNHQKVRRDNTSGYIGVRRFKRHLKRPWLAEAVDKNGIVVYLGMHETALAASRVVAEYNLKEHGIFWKDGGKSCEN